MKNRARHGTNKKSDKELKESLRLYCESEAVDFFGIAPSCKFENAPDFHKPENLLPDVQSVVSFGLKIPEGVAMANHLAFTRENMESGIYVYQMHGYVAMNRKLNQIAYDIARRLGVKGHKSCPIPVSSPKDNQQLMGVFSNRHAAVAAGLANFGWNTLAITRENGPRVRWGSVLTTAQLPINGMIEEEVCNSCMKCVEVCPTGAISESESVELKIDGYSYEYSNLDKWRCRYGASGLVNPITESEVSLPQKPSPDNYLRDSAKKDPLQQKEQVGPLCGRCIVECPIGNDWSD